VVFLAALHCTARACSREVNAKLFERRSDAASHATKIGLPRAAPSSRQGAHDRGRLQSRQAENDALEWVLRCNRLHPPLVFAVDGPSFQTRM
jgi:hypothetical protein